MNKDFKNWVSRCMKLVDEHGLSECDNYRDEVIFAMEEGAERYLSDFERVQVSKIIAESRSSEKK